MSSSSRFGSLLYLISFTLLHQIALGTDPLFHFCSSSGNFPAYGPYEANLNKLTSYLSLTAPPTGFGFGSVGPNQFEANGLALCRGDVSSTDCQSCIAEAGSAIRNLCPNNKGAIIWYDKCELKYSNLPNFLGKIDNQIKFYLWNPQNASNPIYFNGKTKELLRKLADEATSTPILFATGELEIAGPMTLYGFVQCTRDLSSVHCKKCILEAISELPSCCDGKTGGRVVGGSCNLRYEIYPFLGKA